MPNHITNILKVKGDIKEVRKMFNEIKSDEVGIGTIDFNKIIPMPKELQITSGSETDKGLELYLTSINPTVDYFGESKMPIVEFRKLVNELNLERMFSTYNSKMTEADINICKKKNDATEFEALLKLGKQAVENHLNYGATTWYEWSIANWGSKWNAYNLCENSDESNRMLYFNTAWSRVEKVIEKLSEMYPNLTFEYKWSDEDFGSNVGVQKYYKGQIIKEYIPEDQSKEAYELAAEIQDLDLSEDYRFNEETQSYEYIDDDEEQEQTMNMKQ